MNYNAKTLVFLPYQGLASWVLHICFGRAKEWRICLRTKVCFNPSANCRPRYTQERNVTFGVKRVKKVHRAEDIGTDVPIIEGKEMR